MLDYFPLSQGNPLVLWFYSLANVFGVKMLRYTLPERRYLKCAKLKLVWFIVFAVFWNVVITSVWEGMNDCGRVVETWRCPSGVSFFRIGVLVPPSIRDIQFQISIAFGMKQCKLPLYTVAANDTRFTEPTCLACLP